MKEFVKNIIETNKACKRMIENLEEVISVAKVTDEKSKANFANYCIALKGYRMVEEATEAILFNENIVITEGGEYFEKIDDICDADSPSCFPRRR